MILVYNTEELPRAQPGTPTGCYLGSHALGALGPRRQRHVKAPHPLGSMRVGTINFTLLRSPTVRTDRTRYKPAGVTEINLLDDVPFKCGTGQLPYTFHRCYAYARTPVSDFLLMLTIDVPSNMWNLLVFL